MLRQRSGTRHKSPSPKCTEFPAYGRTRVVGKAVQDALKADGGGFAVLDGPCSFGGFPADIGPGGSGRGGTGGRNSNGKARILQCARTCMSD